MPPAEVYKHPETGEIYHARFRHELGYTAVDRFDGERVLKDEVEDNLHIAYPDEVFTRPVVSETVELSEEELAGMNAGSTLSFVTDWENIPRFLAGVKAAHRRVSAQRGRDF